MIIPATITLADCVAWLADYDGPLFDSCVTDPPYHLTSVVQRFGADGAAAARKGKGASATGAYARASKGFMGKTWDGGDVAFRPETWRAVFDKLKPGAHLVAFSGTRTYHRMACAIEDAGFEIRDQLAWAYGSGFPKSHDVSKAIDRAAGAEREKVRLTGNAVGNLKGRQDLRPFIKTARENGFHEIDGNVPATAEAAEAAEWQGWGTALKPSWEPICLARKPIGEASVAANVLKWGTGALNIDGCRVGDTVETWPSSRRNGAGDGRTCARGSGDAETVATGLAPPGRWPANLCHDGSDEVEAGFPTEAKAGGTVTGTEPSSPFANVYGDMPGRAGGMVSRGDSGSAARFFYSAKAGPLDRLGSAHATVKPIDLMRWLCRMVTPPGGSILEPFAGSGTTGIAAMAERFACTMIDIEAEHVADIERKLALLRGDLSGLFQQHVSRVAMAGLESTPLFGGIGSAS